MDTSLTYIVSCSNMNIGKSFLTSISCRSGQDRQLPNSPETLPRPPYSPNVSLTNYHKFHVLQNFFSRKTYDDKEALETTTPSLMGFTGVRFIFYENDGKRLSIAMAIIQSLLKSIVRTSNHTKTGRTFARTQYISLLPWNNTEFIFSYVVP